MYSSDDKKPNGMGFNALCTGETIVVGKCSEFFMLHLLLGRVGVILVQVC